MRQIRTIIGQGIKRTAMLSCIGIMPLLLAVFSAAGPASACTTIIAGKTASATGSCMMAHNENDEIYDCQVIKAVPAAKHAVGETYKLYFGSTVPLPTQTLGFVSSKIYDKSLQPGDYIGVINDRQVSIFNNYAPGKYSPKGKNLILWTEFTELAALQATTAREAVQIIGNLAQSHGNAWGGTLFGIADPNEAWWIEICGYQWVAQRVPDNAVEMRANCYRIGVVDFKDPKNFMWSPDAVTYAQSKRWYKPSQGAFNWTKAYAGSGSTTDADNTVRQTMIEQYLADDLAQGKIDKKDLMEIMRSHFEGSTHYNLNCDPYTPCNDWAIASSIVELRGTMPAGIGGVLWTALSVPCSNGYVPWYEGITAVPTEYTVGSKTSNPNSAYWVCRNLWTWVKANYNSRHPGVASAWLNFEQSEYNQQANVEATALQYYQTDPALAWRYLTDYCGNQGRAALILAQQLKQ